MVRKKILNASLTSLKLTFLISIYSYLIFILIDIFTHPKGSIALMYYEFTILLYLAHLAFFVAPITVGVFVIYFNRTARTVQRIGYIGLIIGAGTIALLNFVPTIIYGEFKIYQDWVIPYIVHMLLTALISKVVFSKNLQSLLETSTKTIQLNID